MFILYMYLIDKLTEMLQLPTVPDQLPHTEEFVSQSLFNDSPWKSLQQSYPYYLT